MKTKEEKGPTSAAGEVAVWLRNRVAAGGPITAEEARQLSAAAGLAWDEALTLKSADLAFRAMLFEHARQVLLRLTGLPGYRSDTSILTLLGSIDAQQTRCRHLDSALSRATQEARRRLSAATSNPETKPAAGERVH